MARERILQEKGLVKPEDAWCPTCGASETNPLNPGTILIRGYKVGDDNGVWWSQCLVCAGYYDKDLNETPRKYAQDKGWFADEL